MSMSRVGLKRPLSKKPADTPEIPAKRSIMSWRSANETLPSCLHFRNGSVPRLPSIARLVASDLASSHPDMSIQIPPGLVKKVFDRELQSQGKSSCLVKSPP